MGTRQHRESVDLVLERHSPRVVVGLVGHRGGRPAIEWCDRG